MRPPFNMLRACYWLLAVVVFTRVAGTVFAGVGCFYLNLKGPAQIGACLPITEVIREEWTDVVAAIFALLLAARSAPPPPPPNGTGGDEQ